MGVILKLNKSFQSLTKTLRDSLLVGTSLVAAHIFLVPGADAQIQLYSQGKMLEISSQSDISTLQSAINGVMSGQAGIRLDPRSVRAINRTGQVAVRAAGRPVVIKRGVSLRRGTVLLNVKSRNKKTAGLSLSFLDLLSSLLSVAEQNNSFPIPSTFVRVFRQYEGKTCEPPQQTIEEMDGALTSRNVKIQSSVCASRKGRITQPSVCGQPFTFYRVHTIAERDKLQAMIAGFSPLDWLREEIQEGACPNFETVEMTGVLTNRTCYSTENSVKDFDAKLADAGIKVLEASCGMETARRTPVCGEPDLTYRKVKIFASQRVAAMSLGLRDSSNWSGLVSYGQECPPVLIVDPPFNFVEMVGIIFNVTCNPPENTVASFDRMLSNAKVTVLASSCGYEKAPSLLPCPTIYREVLVPESDRLVAENLGLRAKRFFTEQVSFGQSCPE